MAGILREQERDTQDRQDKRDSSLSRPSCSSRSSREKPSRAHWLIASLVVFFFTLYGGSKGIIGDVSVRDSYIRDNGSYVTNDAVYISIIKTLDLVPDDTEILIFSREVANTNAEDWTELTPRHIYSDFPLLIPYPNATNYNFFVAASFVPIPTHTNGVWALNGFIIPGTDCVAFPTTTTEKKE